MNILKELNLMSEAVRLPATIVWRRKHGRAAGLKSPERTVWTLTPVAAR